MANNRMTEGVGKKIVEALKMQNDVEITPDAEEIPAIEVDEQPSFDEPVEEPQPMMNFSEDDIVENADEEPEISEEELTDETDDFETTETFNPQPAIQNFESQFETQIEQPFNTTPIMPQPSMSMQNMTDDFEVPSNVAVLKQLISKLPAGVTKQTGAMIIKQTMEALGISMKSVLQEAQQVQEGLNNSTRECQASILEYKKQIGLLEKQAQKYQRQYAALNDIISLFIQTNY